jgi:hypothetical protein
VQIGEEVVEVITVSQRGLIEIAKGRKRVEGCGSYGPYCGKSEAQRVQHNTEQDE